MGYNVKNPIGKLSLLVAANVEMAGEDIQRGNKSFHEILSRK
jgi:hypothetical protein